jgi:glycosyltransferase involved in cell wall biosynthesis
VLPVVPDFSHLDVEPNDLIARDLDDEWTNILFVGRIIPNKRIEDVIRYFPRVPAHLQPRARLLLVGSYHGYEKYLATLQHLVDSLGTTNVIFTGHVTNAELAAYYEIADLFLCASAHEGFCVPIVEAFYKEIPVVAYAASAVPADHGWRRSALHDDGAARGRRARRCRSRATPALYNAIVAKQNEALARLRAKDFDRHCSVCRAGAEYARNRSRR